MRAIVYSRVSTDAQERDGTSLETQERACLELGQTAGWLTLDCIRDSASGYSLDRPGIARVRSLIQQGAVDVVIAHAVDRLSRNQNHIGVLFDEIQQAGARFEFVTEKFEDTAVGRFILAARAFIAEVEREKIAERTMRGKLERARSGRIPQAMGRGTYGYIYNRKTGQREIEPFQAEIVRRIFKRYAETRSFTGVSSELNGDSIQAFAGGRWYPLTIRRILTNESYAGRLVYRRTKWVASRNGKTGIRRRRPVQRPAEEWVEIKGASPRIVDEALWQRVQAILADPERIARRSEARYSYPLRGRVRCELCGSAMVGQTMNGRNRLYHYYVCRVAFDRRQNRSCPARNVRADKLEEGIWREVRAALADRSIVRMELEHQREESVDTDELARLEQKLASLIEREKRLVKLFTYGEVDEHVIQEEGATLKRERLLAEERLAELRRVSKPIGPVDSEMLEKACAAVGEWLDRADESDRSLVLEALQVTVRAAPGGATVNGVLPSEPRPHLPMNKHADARCEVKDLPAHPS
jgi:site-specific DNA recombinase